MIGVVSKTWNAYTRKYVRAPDVRMDSRPGPGHDQIILSTVKAKEIENI
jgi:hypothetical protein